MTKTRTAAAAAQDPLNAPAPAADQSNQGGAASFAAAGFGQPIAATADMLSGTHHVDPLNVSLKHLETKLAPEHDTTLEELRDSLNNSVSMDMNDPHLRKFIADNAFMEEPVLVRVLPSTDPNAEHLVDVYNNGTPQRFPRGTWVIAKRKFVEVLARAKPFSVQTPEYVDPNGDRATRIDRSTALRYPFEMRDRNPVGEAWLSSIISEA
jgi:hypothetical protein